ncbi:hypothetical protein [Actinoplanes flavus]|uniref:Uncharacterized protein n=1 Tax=Actinoplanes flavus TaxID=2820290 RepID=A0ABS3UHI0_9ACTN|nr:hypothetical protein [Actinoplanes flavus]MBO3738244.1 hypothetical protein [Actinoplanes flavus]
MKTTVSPSVEEIGEMADPQPGDETPAAGMPDPTRDAGSGENDPPTAALPGRWSGAAAVPETGPRRSRWSRMVDRLTGGEAEPEDDRTAVPAVDPWADQDTPVWADPWTTPVAPVAPVDLPATRLDAPVPAPSAPPTRAAAPKPAVPPPGTYPPPAAGTGLPALLPPKVRAWGRRTATKGQEAARRTAARGQEAAGGAPEKLRSWGRKVTTPDRIPVQPRPPATPPPWAARPLPRPRRRRRLRRVVLLVVIGLALGYWLVPGARQYPVTAALPDSFADLKLRDTAAGQRAAQRLADELQSAGSGGDSFAGIYADGRGKRVTVFGVTGFRLTPGSDVEAQLARLSDSLRLRDVQPFDLGVFGAYQLCGTGRLEDTAVVACAWADHGSLATVLLTRRSLEESAELVSSLRDTVLEPAA